MLEEDLVILTFESMTRDLMAHYHSNINILIKNKNNTINKISNQRENIKQFLDSCGNSSFWRLFQLALVA